MMLLARMVLKHWASSAGMSVSLLVACVALGAPLLGSVALWAVVDIDPESLGSQADVLLFAVCLCAFVVSSGVGILGSHFSEALYTELVALRVRPVGRRKVALATRLPAIVMGTAMAVVLLPASALLISIFSGYGWAHAGFCSVAMTVTGAAMGWIGHWAGGFMLRGRAARSLRLSVTLAVWFAVVVGSVTLFSAGLTSGEAGYGPLQRSAPLVWPLHLWLLLSASPVAYATVGVVCVAFTAICVRLAPHDATLCVRGRVLRTVRRQGPFATGKVLVARLFRNPRSQEWIVVGALGSLLTVAIATYAARRLPITFDHSAILTLATAVCVSFGCLVRGLSSRVRPIEQRMHVSPARHVCEAMAAAILIGLALASPMFVLVAATGGTYELLGLPLMVVINAGMAVGVSFILCPQLGSGGAEMVAFVAYVLLTMVSGAVGSGLGGGPVALIAQTVVASAVLAASVACETRRRALPGVRSTPALRQELM